MHVDSDQFARADSAISQIECHFREQQTTVKQTTVGCVLKQSYGCQTFSNVCTRCFTTMLCVQEYLVMCSLDVLLLCCVYKSI